MGEPKKTNEEEIKELELIQKQEGDSGLIREADQRESKFGRIYAVKLLRGKTDALMKIVDPRGGLYHDSMEAAMDLLAEAGEITNLASICLCSVRARDMEVTMYAVKKLEELLLADKVELTDIMPVAETIMLYSKNAKARAKASDLCDKAGKSREIQQIMEDHEEHKVY